MGWYSLKTFLRGIFRGELQTQDEPSETADSDSQVPEEAVRIHALAREVGHDGDFQRALELLAQASELAPDWAYPVYDAAFTHLLMGASEKALEYYERVVSMEPDGFFTAITAVDCLNREMSKELAKGTYPEFVSLEAIEDPLKKKALLEKILERSPTFSPGWQEMARLAEDDDERLEFIEKGLSCEPDRSTRGHLLLNKALILSSKGNDAEAIEIVQDLLDTPSLTTDVGAFANLTLMQLRTK